MIDHTFLHCYGIGPKTHRKLIKAGYTNWQSVLNNSGHLPIGHNLEAELIRELQRSQRALSEEDLKYFIEKLPTVEQWRILERFASKASYFDIETTGFSPYDSEITVISCLHRGSVHHFVRDENLDEFLMLLKDVKLLLSFNGASFDVPRTLDHFNIPELPCPHLDLRWQCFHLGYDGGLKRIEKELNIKRDSCLEEIDGLEAIRLWNRWKHGDICAKELLLQYSSADVCSLELITKHIITERIAFLSVNGQMRM